jgi:hypothetical protein
LRNIKGTVKADGDELSLVADRDNKSWYVTNPNDEHHVELRGQMDKNGIHVMSVQMLKEAN